MADTAEQTENQEQESPQSRSQPNKKDGDNQKAIDDAVAAAKEKWEKEVEEKLKKDRRRGMRKAKLTNEQRKKRTTTRNEQNLKKQRQSLNVKKSLHMPKRNLPKSDCLPRLQSTLQQRTRIAQRRLLTR